MTSFVSIRSSTLEDIRAFNGLVNNSGGAVFYRATFGQFNFSSMVETSCISLIAKMPDRRIQHIFKKPVNDHFRQLIYDKIINPLGQLLVKQLRLAKEYTVSNIFLIKALVNTLTIYTINLINSKLYLSWTRLYGNEVYFEQ